MGRHTGVARSRDSARHTPRGEGSDRHALEVIASCEEIVHATARRARRARTASLPDDLHVDVLTALSRGGVDRPYVFQAQAIEALLAGRHVTLAGGTGSGKSLCYQVPILQALRASRRARVLYVAPTKALAQDQARRLRDLQATWVVPALYDGDTPQAQRAGIRRTANLVLTNPDMLSAGIVPAHAEWAPFLAGLRYVVIDESHVYRGIFGSHVANVLRRLRRACRRYGAEPVFVGSSGTIANPAEHFRALTGVEAEVVDDAGAPASGRDIVLWNPALDEDDGARTSPLTDAARIYSLLVEEGVPTIVFARTRRGCELIHRFARDRLVARGREDLAARIAPYRGGYAPQERRETERALAAGDLVGVVATNALELGIDIGTLDASVCVTFPGSVTSLWQQWGRAGRSRARGLNVLVAGTDALDQFFMHDPDALLGRPIERAVINHANPRVLAPHVVAAACEGPIDEADDVLFGEGLAPVVGQLAAEGVLRTARGGWVYTGTDTPARGLSLRSSGGGAVSIVEADTGVIIGTVERWQAPATLYPGAVYLHRGEAYVAETLDMATGISLVRRRTVGWYTLPKVDTDIHVEAVVREREVGGVTLRFGVVTVRDQVVGYQRTATDTHGVIDFVAQPLEAQSYRTEAVWFTPREQVVGDMGAEALLGSLHAAEHGLIALLPLVALCDRADIGGLSTDWHAQADGCAIFVYDGYDGGVGISAAGFDAFGQWVRLAHDAVSRCPCDAGCPSCVQSPKCGNLNDPLDKGGAVTVLASLLEGGQGVRAAGRGR